MEHISQEVLSKIQGQPIIRNMFRIQDNDSIMCGFYCIVFMEYIIAQKTSLDYTNLFSPNDYKNKIIQNYFKGKYGKKT